MGTKLKELITPKLISIEDLSNKILIVDAFNVLYQFLTSIRQMDGTPLKTSKGIVTSHLVGLFNRTTKLMLEGLKLVFVFDGKSPELKYQERERRKALKLDAEAKYTAAKEAHDVESMKKYAARSSRLNTEMIEDAKALLEALGVPVIQAPGEGEAQAASMVSDGLGYAVVSEDYDTLLFGVSRLIKGLSISRRKKERDKLNYKKSEISMIHLEDVLNELKINQDQLIVLGILIGTDFNPGGIKGIGPKKALQLVQNKSFEEIFSVVNWEFSHSWQEVFKIFSESNTVKADVTWGKLDRKNITELLINKFEFSENVVNKKLDLLEKKQGPKAQQSLGAFI